MMTEQCKHGILPTQQSLLSGNNHSLKLSNDQNQKNKI